MTKRRKKAEMGAADHSWHSGRRKETEYTRNWTDVKSLKCSRL